MFSIISYYNEKVCMRRCDALVVALSLLYIFFQYAAVVGTPKKDSQFIVESGYKLP